MGVLMLKCIPSYVYVKNVSYPLMKASALAYIFYNVFLGTHSFQGWMPQIHEGDQYLQWDTIAV